MTVPKRQNGTNRKQDHRAGGYCTFIYAFDASGNYAYAELNVINVPEATPAEPVLSVNVSAETDGKVGGTIKWRAAASGGSGNYLYTFNLYRDGKLIDRRNYSDYSDFEHKIESTGTYAVMVGVYDNTTGKSASVASNQTNIFIPIEIESFKADTPAAMLGQSVSWTVEASGGEGKLKYSYTLYKNDAVVYSTDYKEDSNKFTYKPADSGIYNVVVNIMDSRSQVKSFTSEDITVIRPLSAENVSFSTDYAVAGKSVTCSADVLGGTGSYTCKFSIYCDGTLVLESDNLSTSEFTFTVPQGGSYTATVTVTDDDSTVTEASGGKLTVYDKAQKGDANCDGKFNVADARFALRCSAGLENPDEAFIYAIDVNEDGNINAADARLILRVVSKIDSFY